MPDASEPQSKPARTRRREEYGKVALVLAGGGIPGWMYEVGCLTALDEFFEEGFSVNDFDIYVGTSAGANVAAMIANGIRPREVYDAIVGDQDSPYNFSRRDIYAFGTRETWPMVKKVAVTGWGMGKQIVRGLIKGEGLPSVLDLLYTIQDSLPSGLFTIAPLERHLRRNFAEPGRTNDFRQLDRELYIPAVDLDRGRYTVFGTEGNDTVPISKAAVASSAVPVLFQPVHINGKDYIDGGTGRVANMDVAVDHGAELLLIINPIVHLDNDRDTVCLPTCHGFCNGLRDKGLAFVADQAMRINTSMRLGVAKAHQQRRQPGLDIAIIEPSPTDTVMFTQNMMGHEERVDVVRYGYRATVAHLTENFDGLSEMFAKRGVGVSLDRFHWRPNVAGMRVLGPNERRRVLSGHMEQKAV